MVNLVARRTLPRNWTFDGTNHYNVVLSGGRSARLHITRTYDDSVPHPVIFAFHGANADAGNMEAISGLSSDTLKVAGVDPILVYGQGTVGTNGKSWQGAPYSSSADDVSSGDNVRENLIANLRQSHSSLTFVSSLLP
jgi:poly(3-hydroxybutyrate) depolymerase